MTDGTSLDFHAREVVEAARELGVDPVTGLADQEAEARLRTDGPNLLPRPARPAYLALAARQFADPLVALLVGATVVSAAIGDGLEATAIGAIVVLNAILGFVQEAAAERAVLALRAGQDVRVSVIRDGQERELSAQELVRGDLLVLREGDRVAADARIVRSEHLAADESALTGESLPVEKSQAPVSAGTVLAERASMLYAGTAITRGRGAALVTATGAATELGAIARLTSAAKPPPTPLQRRLGRLARQLVVAGAAITVVLAAGMLLRGSPAHEAFLLGVAVAVAAVPEGLAATVTAALALGARAMAQRGAIVRRLSAIETLGETTVVCTDKTGTLTENRLGVAAVLPIGGIDERALLEAAVLASTAELVGTGEQTTAVGDPTDRALLLAANARGVSREALVGSRRYLGELPLTPERKRMTVVYAEEDGRRVFVKGAPETLFERMSAAVEELAQLEQVATAWAGEGFRVLAVADRALATEGEAEDIEQELRPLGLVALHDPLRPSAPGAIRQARAAGVEVRMLTGDHPRTARTIGRALGLPEDAVFARVTPAGKLDLVEKLQAEGEVVAVTGDGVNDAPALRRADVGIAMGGSGTEAAREAAAIVLTDDDFATIVAALSEGRRIADNVRKFVAFLLSANLGEVLLFAIAVLAGLGVPMTVVQVLTVNLLTDGLPALALARDPVTPETLGLGPRGREALFGRRLGAALVGGGLLVGLAGLGAYLAGRALGGGAEQTMAFATVAAAELVFVFTCRSVRRPAWRVPWNPHLVAGVVGSAAGLAAVVAVPALHGPFGTVALGPAEVAIVAGLAVLPAALVELAKAAARRFASA